MTVFNCDNALAALYCVEGDLSKHRCRHYMKPMLSQTLRTYRKVRIRLTCIQLQQLFVLSQGGTMAFLLHDCPHTFTRSTIMNCDGKISGVFFLEIIHRSMTLSCYPVLNQFHAACKNMHINRIKRVNEDKKQHAIVPSASLELNSFRRSSSRVLRSAPCEKDKRTEIMNDLTLSKTSDNNRYTNGDTEEHITPLYVSANALRTRVFPNKVVLGRAGR